MSTRKEIGVKGEGQEPALPSPPAHMGGKEESRVVIKDMKVYSKHTWGSYGQHSNTYLFILYNRTFIPAFIPQKIPSPILLSFRKNIGDSRKNIHRDYYANLSLPLGTIIKKVVDYASSRRREISITYYIVEKEGLKELEHSHEYIPGYGWVDIVTLPNGKEIILNKEGVVEG